MKPLKVFLQLFALAIVAVVISAPAFAAAPETYLLAIAACPPWKAIPNKPEMTRLTAESCKKDVDAIVPALSKALSIDKDHTQILLNQQANFAGVVKAFEFLADHAKVDDRVVIYLNLHGGNLGTEYKGYRLEDEIFALYTKQEPTNFVAAIENKLWMTAKQMRDLVDRIKAREIIVIIEACQSTAAMHDFEYDLLERYSGGWRGREAIIFSSRADEAAAFTEDGSEGLFTEILSKNLMNAEHGSLGNVIAKSEAETHQTRRQDCMSKEMRGDYETDLSAYLDECTQQPETFDPFGLLNDIAIGGAVVPSNWEKFQIGKQQASSDSGEKQSSPMEAAGAKKTGSADPYGWAKSASGHYKYGYATSGGQTYWFALPEEQGGSVSQ